MTGPPVWSFGATSSLCLKSVQTYNVYTRCWSIIRGQQSHASKGEEDMASATALNTGIYSHNSLPYLQRLGWQFMLSDICMDTVPASSCVCGMLATHHIALGWCRLFEIATSRTSLPSFLSLSLFVCLSFSLFPLSLYLSISLSISSSSSSCLFCPISISFLIAFSSQTASHRNHPYLFADSETAIEHYRNRQQTSDQHRQSPVIRGIYWRCSRLVERYELEIVCGVVSQRGVEKTGGCPL